MATDIDPDLLAPMGGLASLTADARASLPAVRERAAAVGALTHVIDAP